MKACSEWLVDFYRVLDIGKENPPVTGHSYYRNKELADLVSALPNLVWLDISGTAFAIPIPDHATQDADDKTGSVVTEK